MRNASVRANEDASDAMRRDEAYSLPEGARPMREGMRKVEEGEEGGRKRCEMCGQNSGKGERVDEGRAKSLSIPLVETVCNVRQRQGAERHSEKGAPDAPSRSSPSFVSNTNPPSSSSAPSRSSSSSS